MASFAFDIYAANDPNGARLVRLTPSNGVQLAFRLPEIGFGTNDGQITIHSAHADATAANFAKHNLVKVVAIDDSATETKVGGFFLEEGDFTALSKGEEGGRLLKFSGPNTFQYLERAILREQGFTSASIPWPTKRGGIDIDGMWTWGEDADGREPGPIMVRCLEEGRDQPGAPLGDATWDFTRSVDSAGTSWDALGDKWQVPWGTTIAEMAILFIRSGEFHFRWDADLVYSAYKADPSVARTTASFAAGKVRFAAGENIVTEVHRGIDGSQDASAVLVTGSEYETAFVSGGSSSVPWVRHLNIQEATVAARLTMAGQRELDARAVRVDAAFPLTHIVEDDELNGGYIPFVHYAPGDTVTLHTGTGSHDFNEFSINVAAVRIVHDEAGNWFGMPELGAQTIEFGSRGMEERSNRLLEAPNPMLCDPIIAGSEATAVMSTWTWSEPKGDGTFQQTVEALTVDGAAQASFIMGNGFNNITEAYRSPRGGTSIPHEDGVGAKYLPCAEGVDIAFSADVRYYSVVGATVDLHALWYNTSTGNIGSTSIYNQANSGWENVTATLTPPTGAVKWRLGLVGMVDNVAASTGSAVASENPYAGTSIYAARCDHTHPADEHNHDSEYADRNHLHRVVELEDVDTTTPLDGQVLVYDDATETWVAETPSGGGASALDDLTDVDTTTTAPNSTDVLAYNGSLWVPTAAGTPAAHASSHEDGGADEIEIANLPTTEVDTAKVLHPDGAGGVAWGTDATGGGGGGGLTVPDLLNSTKASADTPDAEFAGSISPFTAVDGASGTASLLAGSGSGVYDVSTRSGWVLMMPGLAAGDSVELRQDYTLPDGACIVAPILMAADMAATPTNNEIWMGIAVNDNDTGPFSGAAGQTAAILLDTDAHATWPLRVLGWDGSATIGPNSAGTSANDLIYFRIDRVSLTYHIHWSRNGFTWTYIGSKTMASAANNVWIFSQCLITMANRVVVGVPWFRQGTALAVDPWPL